MKITLITPVLLSLLMVGCGGSGGKSSTNNSSTPIANNPPPTASSAAVVASAAASSNTPASQATSSAAPLLTGVFIDAAVMNIGYRTASQRGFTNANGEFHYRPGEMITFFIGNLEFPPVMAGDIITPLDLANTDDLANHQLINMLRLLQSLDADGDLTNGIGITAAALAAGVTLDFSLPPDVFAQLPAVRELLQAAGGVNKQLVSAEQALAHFRTTLEFINGPASSSSSSQTSSALVSSSLAPSSSASSLAPSSAAASSITTAPTPVPPASSEPAVTSSSSPSSAPVVVPPVSSVASSSAADSSATSEASSVVAESSAATASSISSVADSSVSSAQTSSESSSTAPVVRPAKIEGFAAHAGVTGGAGGVEITVTTGTELNAALCSRASMTTPIVIKVNGTISHANTTAQGCNTQADVIEIKAMSNVSIIGVGSNALFEEIGIHVRDASNIIIQNVHVRNVKKSGSPISNGGDAIGMETNVNRVWIDHNWLEASGGEKDGYDSLLDMKAGVTNVTVSYNLFNDSSRTGLIGSSDSDNKNTNITFHHNWYKNIEQRTPLIRHALVHMYNNYWSNPRLDYMFHGINSRSSGKVLVESNYMYNVNNPLLASDDSPTAGCWQTNNDNTVLPEIYYSRTVGAGALVVPEVIDGQLQSTCVVSVPYTVAMDAAADVPAIVMANVGVGKIDGSSGTGGNSSAGASSVANSNSSALNSSVASSALTTSSAAASSVAAGANLAINEAFNVDKTTLFSAAYQAISTDSSAALYYITGGGTGIAIANNELTLAGGRLTIGHRPPRANTTAGDVSANGDFDLSRPYRISFNVIAGSGSGKFQVYVDNNTTSSGNSLHGANSKVFEAVASSFGANQQVLITPSVGTSTSFIALRAESSATVTIDNLVIEYLDAVGASSSSAAASSEAAVSSAPASSAESSSSLAVSSAPASSVEASSSVAASVEASSSVQSSSVQSSSVQSSSVQSSSVQSSEAQSSAPASSAISSSASSVNGVFINESFSVDKDTLFSAFYHSISTDSSAALYYITGGGSGTTISNNQLTLAGARLTIGHRPPRTNTTSGDVSANGDFDLSRPYRISFKVVAGSGSGKFQVYVDNNTTSTGNSLHGANSKVFEAVASSFGANQQVVITPSVGTRTSFIALRTESSATVTIDDLVIEYTDGLGVGVASSSVASGAQSSQAATSSSVATSVVSSSAISSSASSRSSVAYIPPAVNLSADCIQLATNPAVNWRDTALQTDQEIVECLSKSLGKAVGYGESAKGGFDPNGNSKLTIITKTGGVSVEQQLINALTDNAHNWVVFDKAEFAQPHAIGMYRQYCADPATLSILDASEAECRDYHQWCARKGFNDEATCQTEFFNKAMNKSNIPIRIPAIGSNKTIDGRMTEAYFLFSGFAIGKDADGVPTQTSESVILTHLKFQGAGHAEDHYVDPDMIRSTGASHDIWIHKNTFKETGDSAFDVKIGAYNITMSYNRLEDVLRSSLHGSSDSRTINSQIRTSMHNNFFVTSDAFYSGPHAANNTARRAPLLRRGSAHLFNNVFYNYRKNFASVRVGGTLFMESNVFLGGPVIQNEKSSLAASFSEWLTYLTKDDFGGGYFGSTDGLVTFSNTSCRIDNSYQGYLPAVIGGSPRDLKTEYSQASRDQIDGQGFSAGQDLVDYTNATAGKYGEVPFNSPLAKPRADIISAGQASCL